MNQYEMVALIVLIVVIGGLLKHAVGTFNSRLKEHQLNGDKAKRQKEIDEKRIKQLEQRIEVLESIVTSDGYELNQRFKDLQPEQQEKN